MARVRCKQVLVSGFDPATLESAVKSVSHWAIEALWDSVENWIIGSSFSPSFPLIPSTSFVWILVDDWIQICASLWIVDGCTVWEPNLNRSVLLSNTQGCRTWLCKSCRTLWCESRWGLYKLQLPFRVSQSRHLDTRCVSPISRSLC